MSEEYPITFKFTVSKYQQEILESILKADTITLCSGRINYNKNKEWRRKLIEEFMEEEHCKLNETLKELNALKAMIVKSGLIEVEATTCMADKCGKPIIVKNGTMLVHKDENLRMQQRTVDLQKHAATARKLAAERALADRLAEALEGIWPFIEEDIPHGCNSTAYMNAIELCRVNITAWKEARGE